MFALHWTFIVGFLCYVFCYENLSRRLTTVLTQSSTYYTNTASRASDGVVQTREQFCAITAQNHSKAWLQVDLGQSYTVNNVRIYYRREGDADDVWKQYRFRQFYLDVSNSSTTQTTTAQRTRCYTDHTTSPNIPPNIIDIPCKQTARYVIVETTYDAPEDDKYGQHGAILELCEIEVYGCETTCGNYVCDGSGNCTDECADGYWGPACDSQCPANCKELNFQQSLVPNIENMSSLYVVITVLCISLVVNIFTITWLLRNKVCKKRNVIQEKKTNSDFVSTPGIYDTAEDNAGYQELGQLSGPSHYDQLKVPTTDTI